MKNIKRLSNFIEKYNYFILNDIPPIFLFEEYNLNDEQIEYVCQKTYELFGESLPLDLLNSFYIPEKTRIIAEKKKRLAGSNKNFLFEELQAIMHSPYKALIEEIKDEILATNIDLVNKCLVLFRNIPISLEDVMMVGIAGLYEAINTYQLPSETSFQAFAASKIIMSIKNNFQDLAGITWEEYKNGQNVIYQEGEPKNIANEQMIIVGLEQDEMPTTFEDYEKIDIEEDEKLKVFGTEAIDPLDFDAQAIKKIIDLAFKTLTKKEKETIKKYYGFDNKEPMSSVEIATSEKVTGSSVSYKIRNGTRKIKNYHLFEKYFVEKFPHYQTGYNRKHKEQQTAIYSKIFNLLIAGVEIQSYQTFLQMSGIELSADEIVKIVIDIDAVRRLIHRQNFKISAICATIEKDCKYSNISSDIIKYICQHYSEVSESFDNFYQRMHVLLSKEEVFNLEKKFNNNTK